jgi:putative ABC transport system substrate-binding protein
MGRPRHRRASRKGTGGSDGERREFISLLGGAAAWPLAAQAQQPAMPIVGFVRITTPQDSAHLVAAFRRGLAEIGYVEGHKRHN